MKRRTIAKLNVSSFCAVTIKDRDVFGNEVVATANGRARRAGMVASLLLGLIPISGGALAEDGGYQTADGLAVYLGIIPASVVKGHPSTHTEGAMHEGVRWGPHTRHIVVAVFDAATGRRVENAKVEANIEGLGHVGQQRITLDPMLIASTVTYGSFVTLGGNEQYEIRLEIMVPGRTGPVVVKFSSEHVQ